MTLETFLQLCDDGAPIGETSPLLRALWLDRQGDWNGAHEAIQDGTDRKSAAIHAYLHRKEGDLWNARYWYNTAGRKPFPGSLEEEWRALAEEFSGSSETSPTLSSSPSARRTREASAG